MTRLTNATAALAALLALAAPPADAATLDVEFTGLDLFYGFDGKTNIQTGPVAGDVDAVDAASFYVDDTLLGTIVGDITANLGIAGFRDIPVDGGTSGNDFGQSYFRIDFDAGDADSGLLNLGINDDAMVELRYVADRVQLTITGAATGISDQQPIDRVPGWPGFDAFETVRFTFSSSVVRDLEDDGTRLTQFRARGAGTIAQQNAVIPEPTTAAVAALMGAGLLARRRRHG